MLRNLLIFVFVLLCSFPLIAEEATDPSADAEAEAMIAKAQEGDPVACYQVGVMAMQAGMPDKAKEILEKGAGNGGSECMAALGQGYEKGMFGEVDFKKAFDYYQAAAGKNFGPAMLKLGNMYREGNGVAQDYKMAGRWSMKAAKAGVRQACINLGLHYMMGWGVEKNLPKAYAFYYIGGVESEPAKLQALQIWGELSVEERLKGEQFMMSWEEVFPPPGK